MKVRLAGWICTAFNCPWAKVSPTHYDRCPVCGDPVKKTNMKEARDQMSPRRVTSG